MVKQRLKRIAGRMRVTRLSSQSLNFPRANNILGHFVHIPKTAGTSTLNWLRSQAPVWEVTSGDITKIPSPPSNCFLYSGHLHPDKVVQLGLVSASNAAITPAFAYVRNPYQRALSLYWHFRTHSDFDGSFDSFLDLLTGPQIEKTRTNQRIRQMSRPMTYWTNRNPKFSRIRVFPFESLQQSQEALARTFGLTPPAHFAHPSRVESKDLKLTIEQMARLNEIYEDDFSQFNYSQIGS